jgi:hypothetical protein
MVEQQSVAWADVLQAFQQIWGYSDFRPPQDAIVRALLNRQDILVVLPTGENYSPLIYFYKVNNNKTIRVYYNRGMLTNSGSLPSTK